MLLQQLRDEASRLKQKKQALFNETFLWVGLAREAVKKLPNTEFEFSVPKAKKPNVMRTVSRNDPQKLKERIVNKDIYYSAFTLMVAAVEDYLFNIAKFILLYDYNRIKYTAQGINSTNSISIIDLIDNNKEDLIKRIIDERLTSLFYASPNKQLEYFTNALDINISNEIWNLWIESKARRDIIVHNSGIVNDTYLRKLNTPTNLTLGDEIVITDEYFKDTVSFFKRMTGYIDGELRAIYK